MGLRVLGFVHTCSSYLPTSISLSVMSIDGQSDQTMDGRLPLKGFGYHLGLRVLGFAYTCSCCSPRTISLIVMSIDGQSDQSMDGCLGFDGLGFYLGFGVCLCLRQLLADLNILVCQVNRWTERPIDRRALRVVGLHHTCSSCTPTSISLSVMLIDGQIDQWMDGHLQFKGFRFRDFLRSRV